MRCEYCGCEVWIPKGDQKTIVCDCGRTEHADPCYDDLTAQEVANMPLTVRHKIIALHFDIEDLYDKVRYLEADNKRLDLIANSLKGFVSLSSRYFDAQESAGHDVPAWVASMDAYTLFLDREPPKEQPKGPSIFDKPTIKEAEPHG